MSGGGPETAIKKGQSKACEAWMLRPEGKSGTDIIFENVPVSCLIIMPVCIFSKQFSSNKQPHHHPPPKKKETNKETNPQLPQTQCPQTTKNPTENPRTWRTFKSFYKFVTLFFMGRDGVFKAKCVLTILKQIIFPFLTANIINQFIHSITLKCRH